MSTAELKIDLINRITQLKDIVLIEEIQRLMDFELDKGNFELSSKQKTRILEAKKEYQSGKTLSESDANNQIQEWLKR